MSISTEITRLTNDRNTIRNKLVSLGLARTNDNLDELATKVDSIVDRGAISASIAGGETYTIPAGYHNGAGTITATGSPSDYPLQAKNATPTTSQQAITPDSGYYGLSSVTVGAIPANYADVSSVDAVAADVLANKLFVSSSGTLTAGTMVNNGAVQGTINGLNSTTYTIPSGYHNGSGTVSLSSDIEDALALI